LSNNKDSWTRKGCGERSCLLKKQPENKTIERSVKHLSCWTRGSKTGNKPERQWKNNFGSVKTKTKTDKGKDRLESFDPLNDLQPVVALPYGTS